MKFSKYISQQILFSSADNGDGEIRTLDPLLARQVLSQLSYAPILMGLSGLEPPTSRLSGVRSNQLSYKPIFFCNLAATYSPTPSPVQYHRPFRSLPSCSGWERVLPRRASPPELFNYCL